MALTTEQRERRKRFLGSSDIASICGFSEFANASDVWLEKTGRLKEDRGSDAADIGVDMEETVIQQVERRLDRDVKRHIWLDDGGFRCANLDGALQSDDAPDEVDSFTNLAGKAVLGSWFEAPVEAKSTGYKEDYWGEEIDAVPAVVKCQLHWQMDLIGEHCQYGLTGVIWPSFKSFKFELYRVTREQDLIDELNDTANWFWAHVQADIEPPNTTPHLETLKRRKRIPATVISLGDEADVEWKKYRRSKEREEFWKASAEQRYARIVKMLGDNEAGRLPCGDTITYLEQNGKRNIDLDVLEFRAPELYRELVTQGRYRVLRRAKAKVGKRRR